MYEVTITTQFSAAHRLKYLDGKYENLHGHNWVATVTVQSKELNAMGVGIDFVDLKKQTDDLLSRLDYQTLNEVPPFDAMNPSAENVARWLYGELNSRIQEEGVGVKRVEIRELPNCGAAYYE
jgi:6-pyruvoyltetrahydropterin/6-carboxytetrahydropterin synthase